MITTIKASGQFRFYAAAIALAALAITVLAVAYATGPAQAQSNDPQLCGPSQDHFPEKPDEVVSEGHYALFDAYWQPASLDDDTRTGNLNDNLCPPAAAHTDVNIGGGQMKEVTTRSPSKIDVRTTIIQVKDTHKVDVVATNAEAGTDKLSLDKYKEVRAGLGLGDDDSVPAGTKVHWLRLEDPALDLSPSDLVLGFSTGLLDGNYWDNPGDGPTFEYEMESVRVVGPKPADLPHVLTYWEPEMRNDDGTAKVVWDGVNTDVNSMPMEAGEYEHLEWVFTKPGTYIVQVHLKGHVRQNKPPGWKDRTAGTWKKLTGDKTVTSEVKRYVFQVGDLHINAQPHFGYHRTVDYRAPAGAPVGAPIPVYGGDHDQLHYTLEGVGSGNFKVKPATTTFVGKAVQLVVSENSSLRSLGEPDQFDLRLRVKDKHDIEDNADNVIDDVATVRITVQSSNPWVSLKFLNENPRVGDQVKVVAEIHGGDPGRHEYRLYTIGNGGSYDLLQSFQTSQTTHEFTITRAAAGPVVYAVEAWHGDWGPKYPSPLYPIIWRH